jgi:hypothetical protein
MTIQSDNMATVCNLARQSACLTLLKMTRAIFSLLTRADIRITAVHIPGITNTLADGLSRLDLAGDYELDQATYQRGITTLQVTPSIDCFATMYNRKCPRFFAPSMGKNAQGAIAIDAFSQNWSTETLPYLHPPIATIPRVMQKILAEKIFAVLVVPFWPGHSWWSTIQPLILRSVDLGPTNQVLKRGPTMDPKAHKLPQGRLLMCLISSAQSPPLGTD